MESIDNSGNIDFNGANNAVSFMLYGSKIRISSVK